MGSAYRIPVVPVHELAGRCRRAKVFVARGDFLGVEGIEGHTVKILRCAALIDNVEPDQRTVFVQITTGNYGLTLGRMAKDAEKEGKQIQVVNVVD
jgi:hypothetical protein